MAGALSVCIVSYFSDSEALSATVQSLAKAVQVAGCSTRLILVDNSAGAADSVRLSNLLRGWASQGWLKDLQAIELRQAGENIGYGRANNMGLLNARSEFLLVLNPDVRLREDSLRAALGYLAEHTECGLLTPRAMDVTGNDLYLNHGYPSVLALAGRAIRGLQRFGWIRRSVDRYELRDQAIGSVHHETICASGCFMLLRGKVFRRLPGFDPSFFLYFEDYDLSVRIRQSFMVSYVPEVVLEHLGGDAASKGFAHRRMFMTSAFRFFRRHGWRWH